MHKGLSEPLGHMGMYSLRLVLVFFFLSSTSTIFKIRLRVKCRSILVNTQSPQRLLNLLCSISQPTFSQSQGQYASFEFYSRASPHSTRYEKPCNVTTQPGNSSGKLSLHEFFMYGNELTSSKEPYGDVHTSEIKRPDKPPSLA